MPPMSNHEETQPSPRVNTQTTYLVRSLVLMAAAVVLNLVLGPVVRDVLQWPVYLDSVGTILAGALFGPLAGAVIGVVTNIIWGTVLGDPAVPEVNSSSSPKL